jgi:hypothetical protein
MIKDKKALVKSNTKKKDKKSTGRKPKVITLGQFWPKPAPVTEAPEESSKEEQTAHDAKSIVHMGREIVRLGTQMPTIRVGYLVVDVTSTASGVINTVFPFDYTNINDSGPLTSLFDEYRFVRSHICYVPISENNLLAGLSQANPGNAVGHIDYDSSNALTNYNSAWSFVDTAKPFCLNQVHHWSVEYAFQPDQAWHTTATDTIAAWFKLYAAVDVVSYRVGRLFAWTEFQFRAVQ